jgi:hypothetical protein
MLDIWRCAIVKRPIEMLASSAPDRTEIVWLPESRPMAFRADPFGLWRNDRLHVFAEAFDYRDRLGHIDLLVYDAAFRLLECRPVLKAPWHLSYPFVFEADGETWMLPEAYRSGTLTLYRARQFPDDWEAVCRIPLDGPAIDPTPFFYRGKWWLFYTPSGVKATRRSHLHVAWAERLTGPWTPHRLNPVRVDLASGRAGGTPFVEQGRLILPVQDCRRTYGKAIRALSILHLDEERFEAEDSPWLDAPAWMAPFSDGFHTIAAAGPVTLIDVKRMVSSPYANIIRVYGLGRRMLRESGRWIGGMT